MIRVTAKNDGFRRCGTAFFKAASEFPDDRFSKAELEILKAEPLLTVEVIADPEASRLSAKDAAAAASAAETLEALEKLAEGEDRSTVLAAVEKRRKELAPA